MSTISRVECRKCGNVSESYARPGRCVDDRCNGEMVEVKYFRVDLHQVVVEDNERLRKAIEAHQAVEYADLPGNCDEAFLVALAEIDATLYAALTEEKR